MKKLLVFLLVLAMTLSLCGCLPMMLLSSDSSDDTDGTYEDEYVEESTITISDPEPEELFLDGAGIVDDYEVTINDYTLTYDYLETPIILIDLSFTNNSTSHSTAGYDLTIAAFQDGMQLNEAFFTDDWPDIYSEVQAGATADLRVGYELTNLTSPVDFRVADDFEYGEPQIRKEFIIDENGETVLQQAPEGDPQADIDGLLISVASAQKVYNFIDEPSVSITFGVTNNREYPVSFGQVIYVEAFQEGVQLESSYAELENIYNEYLYILPGAGTAVNLVFELRSDAPVDLFIRKGIFGDDALETTIYWE